MGAPGLPINTADRDKDVNPIINAMGEELGNKMGR